MTECEQTMLVLAMEPAESEDEELGEWYRKQHLDMSFILKHYRRFTRYRPFDSVKPIYFALDEFRCTPSEMDMNGRQIVTGTE